MRLDPRQPESDPSQSLLWNLAAKRVEIGISQSIDPEPVSQSMLDDCLYAFALLGVSHRDSIAIRPVEQQEPRVWSANAQKIPQVVGMIALLNAVKAAAINHKAVLAVRWRSGADIRDNEFQAPWNLVEARPGSTNGRWRDVYADAWKSVIRHPRRNLSFAAADIHCRRTRWKPPVSRSRNDFVRDRAMQPMSIEVLVTPHRLPVLELLPSPVEC